MKKLRYDNLCEALIVCVLIFMPVAFVPYLGFCTDQLIIYNMARNVLNGLEMYRDISAVMTPMSVYINAALLKIFGDQYIVTYLLGAVIGACIYCMVYDITKYFSKYKSRMDIVLIVGIEITVSVAIGYTYNFLLVFIILVIIEIMIKDKISTKGSIVIGLMYGICPLVKQSTGLVIMGVGLLTCIASYWIIGNKKDKIALQCVCEMVPSVIYIIYLKCTDNLEYFLDYCLYGVLGDFAESNRYFLDGEWLYRLLFGVLLVLMVIGIAYGIYSIHVRIKSKDLRNMRGYIEFSLLGLCIANLFALYPIFDFHHACVALLPVLIFDCNFINDICHKCTSHRLVRSIMVRTIVAVLIFFKLSLVFYNVYIIMNNSICINNNDLNHFNFCYVDTQLYNNIKTVNEYIEDVESSGKKVIMVYSSAMLYNVARDVYYKDWDLLNAGNFGTQTPEEMVDKLDTENTIMLILIDENGDPYGWANQEPTELLNYIMDTFESTGEKIEGFTIFEYKDN